MSDAMSRATCHLERLLKELQSDSTIGGYGAGDGVFPEASDSAGLSGSSELLGKEALPSSRISLASNSESDDASILSGCDGTKYYREETARLVQQLGDSRVLVATLEAREAEDSFYIQRLAEEVLRFEETVQQEVGNLTRRQDQVELEVQPSLEEQLKTIKDVLHDFDVSEPLYMELKSIPELQRNAREHIMILAYEKFLHDRKEIQKLRSSQDSSREALTRANDEVQKLTDELHRVAANHGNDRRISELDSSANVARIERLESERRDSLTQIEVLSAIGALLDEVQSKLENLERRSIAVANQKAAVEATLQVTTQEKESLRGSIKDKDHNLDLMSVDKAYLSKEVESLKEQLRKLESELEQQHEKLRDVKRERSELHNKVLSVKRDSQAEILQINEQTNHDIQLSRKEADAIADEKVRTSCEIRDKALVDLRDSKAACDELVLKVQELQRAADLKEAEAQINLRATNSELEELKATNNELEKSLLGLKEELQVTRDELEIFQKEKERIESCEREKAKSFSAWRTRNSEGSEGKLKGSVHENQMLEQILRGDNEEGEKALMGSQSLQGDIRKLLRARSSVEELHSLLKEKGLSISVSRLKSITTSSTSSLKDKKPVYSPRISNLNRISSPTRKEIQRMIENGETPPRCHQHRSCSPHYPKPYEELVDAMSRRGWFPLLVLCNESMIDDNSSFHIKSPQIFLYCKTYFVMEYLTNSLLISKNEKSQNIGFSIRLQAVLEMSSRLRDYCKVRE